MEGGNTRLRTSASLKKDFSKKLLQLLLDNNMNQAELGRRIGLSRDAVSTYARGRSLPSDKTLAKIASVFGVPPDDLLPTRFDAVSVQSPTKMTLLDDGRARLQIDVAIDVDTALDIVGMLREKGVYAKTGS